jgi:hypothetical protein
VINFFATECTETSEKKSPNLCDLPWHRPPGQVCGFTHWIGHAHLSNAPSHDLIMNVDLEEIMMKKTALGLSLLVFLASCASPAATGPTETPLPASTLPPSATGTATPEPTPTVTSTPTETPMPVNVADYTPENTPQMFAHNGMWWNRTSDESGKFVWKAVYENGTPIEGMEYVTMEHFDLYLGNAHMFMVAYNLGDFHILVSPELMATLDFGKSGQTPESIGVILRKALIAKATDEEIKAKLSAGAPAYAILGEKEDVWHMPCSPSSALKLRPIQSPDKTQEGEYICRDGNGYSDSGPLSELDGSVVFGQFWLKRDYAQLNLIKPNSFEVVSGLENRSPLLSVANAVSKGTISEKWAVIYGPQGGGKLASEFATLLSGFADIDWVSSD